MDTELLKLGALGAVLILAIVIVKESFSFASKRTGTQKNSSSDRAGDVAPEIYLTRFDKLDGAVAGMVKIMEKQTDILGDIRDWVIKQG